MQAKCYKSPGQTGNVLNYSPYKSDQANMLQDPEKRHHVQTSNDN